VTYDLIELPFEEKIELFIDYVFGGRHHTRSVVSADVCYFIKFYQDLSTWDGNILTKIVVAAHDLGLRVDAEPNGMRGMRVMVHNRKQRDGMSKGHPTLEQHLQRIGRVTKWEGGES
jgi:hypothetical protein